MGEIGKLRHKPTKLKIKLKSSHSKEYSNLELLGEGQSQLHNQNTFFPLALLRLLFSCPVVSDSETSWTAAHQAFLSISISQSLLKLLSIESTMLSKHLFLCRPLLLPSIFPSIRVFTNESALHIRWPEHWSFSISPSNEYSGLISFKIDWLDLLPVQGTLKSLLQHHSSKASVLWHTTFFIGQLSHPSIPDH